MGEGVFTGRKIRVMIVDDSTVIRGSIRQILGADEEIEIVSSLSDGSLAVQAVGRVDPDVVILDIEMPVMDGITALQKMLEIKPGIKVIICSTLSDRNAEISIKALSLGATDCVLKPSSAHDLQNKESFHRELLHSVKVFGRLVCGRKHSLSTEGKAPPAEKFTLRPPGAFYKGKPNALAIGCSTGGPQALGKLLPYLKYIPVPVFITQHMPPVFTRILAENLSRLGVIECSEAQDGMTVEPGKAYIAKGGIHMTVECGGAGYNVIRLLQAPPENYCIPSVEPMLRSLHDIYDAKMLVVIMTGMGNDGLQSCRHHIEKEGRLIAQDEKSSVIWGMPGAVAMEGLCASVGTIEQIGEEIRDAFNLPALVSA